VLDWLYDCNDLVNLSPDVEQMMPTVATMRFKGPVAKAWRSQSGPVQSAIRQSWDHLKEWVLHRYLGETWYTEQRLRYTREVFRSATNPTESPAEYIQRRILQARIFLRFTPNSPEETASIMENAPTAWDIVLRWSDRPPIEVVLMAAKQFEAALIQQWEATRYRSRRMETPATKRANLVSQDHDEPTAGDPPPSNLEDDPGGAFCYSDGEQDQEEAVSNVFNASGRTPSRFDRNRTRFRPRNKSKDGEERTYPFPRDDSVVSHNKPGQNCFACGSDKHWVRECKHYPAYSINLERKAMAKEHRRYETPSYKAAYAAVIDASSIF
jgi:hypothetical protein